MTLDGDHCLVGQPETLVVAIPAGALRSKQRLVAEPARGIVISADPSRVLLGGGLSPVAEEAALRAVAGNELHITLTSDRFLSSVLTPGAASTALLDGIFSTDERAAGWNRMLRPQLSYMSVAWTYANASRVTISLPQAYRYDVTAPETIHVLVPAIAVESGRRATVPASFVILASEPVAGWGRTACALMSRDAPR